MFIVTWYVAMQLFALAAWPLIFSVCNRLADRGYALSKGLGLLLITYITWALAHLGGKWSAFGFSFQTVSIAWFVVLALSLVSLVRNGPSIWTFFRRNLRYIVSLELLMLAAFCAMVGLKTVVPHISYHTANVAPGYMIDHAAEKFTDFAVLNSLLTSSAFPPHDAWVSGDTLNYYYFGHMLWAVLIKFCSVRPEIGFNLALASAFCLTVTLAYGLGYNLTRKLRWGALLTFLIVLCSNLDGFLQLVTALKTAAIDASGERLWYVDVRWWRNYEFWRSSRAIANTINEFPAFSFILGDLHAHVSALVINLCGWHIAVQIWRGVRRYRSLWRYEINAFDELILAALIVGALSASNSWDAPLYTGVLGLAMYCGFTGRRDPYAYWPNSSRIWNRLVEAAEAIIVAAIIAVIGIGLFFMPFLKSFHAPRPADGSMLKLVSPENRSDPFEFVGHWVLLGIIPVIAVSVIALQRNRKRSGMVNVGKTAALTLLIVAAAIVIVPYINGWVAAITGAGVIVLGWILLSANLPPVSRLLVGLLMMFCVMTCFCEIMYVDDIFSGTIERINTVFKVYYGLWPMMAVATLLGLRLMIRLPMNGHRIRRAMWLVLPLIVAGSPYMVLGTLNRVNSSTWLGHWDMPEGSTAKQAPTPLLRPEARAGNLEQALDGMRYLTFIHPDDYAAIMWVRATLPPDAILLEAAGSQYTYSGRFCTLTGRPAFAGWLTHSWGWRGSAFEDEYTRRLEVAATIYNTPDPKVALTALKQENIQYIIVGNQEKEQYLALDARKFTQIAHEVFRQGSTVIYKLNDDSLKIPANVKPPS